MSYVSSKNVEVFPVAKARSTDAPGTRIFTERNISNLSRQLLSEDNPGYIISCKNGSGNNFNVAFNLYGYYFNITDFNPSTFTGDTIYANINIDANGEIAGQDVEGNYEGLDLTNTATKTNGWVSLKLFEKVNGSWTYAKSNFGLVSALAIGGLDGKYSQ